LAVIFLKEEGGGQRDVYNDDDDDDGFVMCLSLSKKVDDVDAQNSFQY
tara:strand:+ start:385 stop:528 length:144 start_codon:yes stop_codon:yes gene_type:complete